MYTEIPYYQDNLDMEMIKNIFTKAAQQFNNCNAPEKLILASLITAIKDHWHDHCPAGVQWTDISQAAAQHPVFDIGKEVLRRHPVNVGQ